MAIELDNNATTRPLPEVVRAMEGMLTALWHNPSSVHRSGQAARQRIELARQSVARLIGARPRDIVFTSGATESIHLAVRATAALAPRSRRVIVTSAIEHEAVRDLCAELSEDRADPCFEIRLAPLHDDGSIDADGTIALIDHSVAIVSIQWANNETGVIHAIEPIAAACRERGVPFHTDATQAVGKIPVDVESAPIDLLSFSAHKMHGPKGVGALYVRRGMAVRPMFRGPQEMERRGGTENAPGIVGFGVAAEAARTWLSDPANAAAIAALRNAFEREIMDRVPDARVNGGGAARLWNTTNVAFPGLEAEALLLLLSERGVNASAGAACSSGSLDPSPVLLAMGIPEREAHGSLRFSLSRETGEREVADAARIVGECVRRLSASAGSVA